MEPSGNGPRRRNDAAGEHREQIRRTEGDAGQRLEYCLRWSVAKDPFLTLEHQRGGIAAAGKDENGRSERRHALQPHGRGTLETDVHGPANAFLASASRQSELPPHGSHARTGRRHLRMHRSKVGKRAAGIRRKRDGFRDAAGSYSKAKGKRQKAKGKRAGGACTEPRSMRRAHFAFCILTFASLIFFSTPPFSIPWPLPASAFVHAAMASCSEPRRACTSPR